MPGARSRSVRLLPDGSPLRNRLLAALPRADYERIMPYVRMSPVTVGHTLQAHRARIKDVYFPNGGVFSITNEMQNGRLVEVATVGPEGMLGVGVFFGDRDGIGRTFQQVPNGVYAQANLLQVMQCTACNALHNVTQRCCRWLLQTRDRVDEDTFSLKQEFLAVMLGVYRPTVTLVLRALQREGLITSHYGQISILKRKRLEAASCECYGVIRAHFVRLGL